jgi:dihydroorotate dehydrogenase
MNGLRRAFVWGYQQAYTRLMRPLIFRSSAQETHERVMRLVSAADGRQWMLTLLRLAHHLTFEDEAVDVGGVRLETPLILAAGFVKGMGFTTEAEACEAVVQGENIIPGWRSMPQMVGPVEFGSFTRWPRLGNPGVVIWRDAATRSTQNRVGLKNPGAMAAAAFLGQRRDLLPRQFGINIAVSPGVTDPTQERQEALEALSFFIDGGVIPAWFTLNLSCPNTEDDPGGHQTEQKARELCGALVDVLGGRAPLWVKIGPSLAEEQYRSLLRAFHDVGVRAVVATNTLAQPLPDDATMSAGVGGGRLHRSAVQAASILADEKARRGLNVDIIGCGGVLDGRTYADFAQVGVKALQYWSALAYRGPLAAAVIAQENRSEQRKN